MNLALKDRALICAVTAFSLASSWQIKVNAENKKVREDPTVVEARSLMEANKVQDAWTVQIHGGSYLPGG